MYTLSIPPLPSSGNDVTAFMSAWPSFWAPGAQKLGLLHRTCPFVTFFKESTGKPALGRTLLIKGQPPIDNTFDPKEAALKNATPLNSLNVVSAVLTAAAEADASSHTKDKRGEHECIHANLRGYGQCVHEDPKNLSNPVTRYQIGPGGLSWMGHEIPYATLVIEGMDIPTGHTCGYGSGGRKAVRFWNGAVYDQTSTPGYENIDITALAALSFKTGDWTDWGDFGGKQANFSSIGEGDEATEKSVSFTQTDYNGGYLVYPWGEHSYYGGFTRHTARVEIASVWRYNEYYLRVTYKTTWKSDYFRYVNGTGSSKLDRTDSGVVTSTTWAIGIFAPGTNCSVDGEYDYLYESMVRYEEALVRGAFKHCTPPSVSSVVRETIEGDMKVLSSNNIENLVQLRQVQKMLPALDELVTLLRLRSYTSKYSKAILLLEILSSWYLKWRYAWKPTLKDLEELGPELSEDPDNMLGYHLDLMATATKKANALKEKLEGKSICRGYTVSNDSIAGYDIQLKTCAKVVFARGQTPGLANSPYFYGLHPGLAQGWDLVPGSFVADWFLGIGNMLAELDFVLLRNMFRLHYILASHRISSEVLNMRTSPIRGKMDVIDYRRFGMANWPSMEPIISERAFSQYSTAGAALLFANWSDLGILLDPN